MLVEAIDQKMNDAMAMASFLIMAVLIWIEVNINHIARGGAGALCVSVWGNACYLCNYSDSKPVILLGKWHTLIYLLQRKTGNSWERPHTLSLSGWMRFIKFFALAMNSSYYCLLADFGSYRVEWTTNSIAVEGLTYAHQWRDSGQSYKYSSSPYSAAS